MHPAAMRSGEKLLKYVDDGRRPDDCRTPWLLPCGREFAFERRRRGFATLGPISRYGVKTVFHNINSGIQLYDKFVFSVEPASIRNKLKDFLAFNETMAFSLSDCHL